MSILQLLASSNYITLNKRAVKVLGIEEALLLGELCSEYDYWQTKELLEDGMFFSTVENIENNTTLNDYKQRKALKKLEGLGLLEVTLKGIPSKRYFKLNEEQILNVLGIQYSNNFNSRSENFKDVDFKNLKTNNNKYNNNINNNIYIVEIVDYLNNTLNSNYRATTKKTKSLINARLKEGFTVDDFKTVIDNKYREWKNTDFEKFLRPETLFGTKFESYLNQKSVIKQKINTNNPFLKMLNEERVNE